MADNLNNINIKAALTMVTAMSACVLSLLAIAYVMKMFENLEHPIFAGIGALVAMGLFMAEFVVFMHALDKFGGIGIIGKLEGMGTALLAIAATTVILGSIDLPTAIQGAILCSVLLVSLGGALALAGKMDKDNKNAVKAIASMGLVLAGLVAAFAILGDMDADDVLEKAAALSLIMVAIGGALLLASKSGGIKATVAASLAAIAVALLGIAAAVTALSAAASAGNLWTVIGGLAAIFLVLVGAIALLSVALSALGSAATDVSPGLLAIAAVVGAISLAIVAVGLAAVLFAAGFVLMSNALKPFSDGIKDVVTTVAGLKDKILVAGETIVSFAKNISKALILVASGLTIFGTAALVAGLEIVVLAAGAVALGAGLVVAAAGCAILAAAVYLLSLAFSSLLTVITQAIQIGEYIISGLVQGMVNGITTIINTIATIAGTIIGTICSILDIHSPSKVMKKIGGYIVDGLASGISGGEGETTDSVTGITDSIKSKFTDGSSDLSSKLGEYVDTDALTGSMDDTKKSGTEAADSTNDSILSSFTSGSTDLSSILSNYGSDGASSLADGLTSNSDEVSDATSSMTNSMLEETDSASESMKDSGRNLVKGFVEGIELQSWTAKNATRRMSLDAINEANNTLGIHSPSVEFKKIGKFTVAGFVKGLQISAGGLKKTVNKTFAKNVFKTVRDTATNYANLMKSLGHKSIYKSAENAVGSLIEELYKESDAYKESTANIKEYQKELSKLEAKRKKAKSSDDIKDIDSDIKEVKANIKAEQKQMNKDMQSTWNESLTSFKENVSSGLDFFTDSIESAIDLFADFDESTADAVESTTDLFGSFDADSDDGAATSMINSMQEAYDAVDTFNNNIQTLKNRGMADGLLQELEDLGVDGAEKVQAFVDMTDEQFQQANDIWTKDLNRASTNAVSSVDSMLDSMRNQVTEMKDWESKISQLQARGLDSALVSDLKELGTDGMAQVDAFLAMSDSQLAEANALQAEKAQIASSDWLQSVKDNQKATSEWAANMSSLAAKGISEGLYEELMNKGVEGESYVEALLAMSPEELQKVNALYKKNLKLDDTVAEEIYAGWALTGTNMMKGMRKGIRKGKSSMIKTAAKAAADALQAAKDVLGIHSPSKEFAKVGMYSDMGMANGLKQYSNVITDSAEDVGTSAVDTMAEAIKQINDCTIDEIDTDPTIRPVLDLSEIQNGTNSLNAMLSKNQAIDINTRMNDQMSSDNASSDAVPGGTNITFTQNNYSPEALSRLDIYRQTRNQLTQLKGALA